MYSFPSKLVSIIVLLWLLMGGFHTISSLHISGDRLVQRSDGSSTEELVWRRKGCFGCQRLEIKRRNNKHRELFPLPRSTLPSPPPPPVGGRQRAMNVPPAPASASSYH